MPSRTLTLKRIWFLWKIPCKPAPNKQEAHIKGCTALQTQTVHRENISCRNNAQFLGLRSQKLNSPPAKSQNPSPPLHPTTDKLGFSGCLEQSVVTPQSTGVHNQSNDDLFRQMEKCMCFHGNQEPRAGSIQNPVYTKRTPFDIFRPFRGEKD